MFRADVWGIVRAVVALGAVLWAPGFCAGWLADVLGFRARRGWEQAAWAIGLSFLGTPIVMVLAGRYAGLRADAWLAGGLAVVAAALGLRQGWSERRRFDGAGGQSIPGRGAWGASWGWGLALGWVVLVIAELVDVPAGDRLYLSVTVFDHALRTAFVDAVLRTGVPPANPLFWPGHAVPMRYYYFWYVPMAVAARLAGASARQGLIASVVWAGLGLAAAVALYCREFLDVRGKVRWWGLALLGVTGLDLLPAIAKALAGAKMDADMDWWSPDQVGSWLDSVLWVPHHVAGLVGCVVAFLLVWASRGRGLAERMVCAVLAGFGFASAFGCSTWVAVAFAAVMAVWIVWTLGWERQSCGRAGVLAASALVALVLLTPYLAELQHGKSGTLAAAGTGVEAGGAGRLLRFGVRHMIDPNVLAVLPGFRGLAVRHAAAEDALAGLLLLLPGYALELGFFAAVLVLAMRRWRMLEEAARCAVVLAVAGLAVAGCIRSTVLVNNDFGYRSVLVAQFFLLVLGVLWADGRLGIVSRRERQFMLALLALGVSGSVYQAVELRVYMPVQEHLRRAAQAGLAERAMAVRLGFEAMDERLPAGAVVEFRTTDLEQFLGYAKVMFARRQMAEGLPECAAAFGGDPAQCAATHAGVQAIFAGGMPAEQARQTCAQLGIDALAATRWDGVWQERTGWVWQLPVVASTESVRVLDCRETMR